MELDYLLRQQDELLTWIEFLQTKYYQKKCNQLVISMPEQNDKLYYYKFDFDDDAGDRDILTILGFQKVRTSIRQEEKEKREAFGFWVTLLIGLIGAIIGLVSILKI
jgi:hypothetical protein